MILAFDWRNGSRKSLHACVSEFRMTVLKEDNSLQPLQVHCLKQTAEPSLCSIVGFVLALCLRASVYVRRFHEGRAEG